MQDSVPTEDEWLSYFDALSNWGRWGDDDVRGTLNFITPEHVRSAASLIRTGETVSCSRVINFGRRADEDPNRPLHFMARTGTAAQEKGGSGASDWAVLPLHGLTLTHIDAHSHMFWDGMMYNGQLASAVTAESGARQGGLEPFADGVVGRAVLVDVPALHGLDWLEESHAITSREIDAALKLQETSVASGDILVVRTGYGQRRRVDPLGGGGGEPDDMNPLLPGLSPEALPWFYQNEISVVGTDTGTEARPSPYTWLAPFHSVAMCAMGMWVIDNLDLEAAARKCRELGRWTFHLTIAPMRLKYVTGCPVNPIATF